jgi:hypothetical protein
LRTLFLSLRSFSRARRLFSITSALFDKNTRVACPILILRLPDKSNFVRPLFSWSYELLFPQALYFHNHLRCPGGVGYPALKIEDRLTSRRRAGRGPNKTAC